MKPMLHATAVIRSFTVYLAAGLRAHRVYLVECLLGLATYPLELAITYLMWRLFLTGNVGGMAQQDALAYYALVLLVSRIGPARFVSLRVESEVAYGNLAVFLVRPMVPWAAIAGRELAPAIVNLLALTPIGALAVYGIQGTAPHVVAFLVWMIPAMAILTLVRLIVGTVAFWLLRIVGLVHAVEFVMGLASGRVLPLSFFPNWVEGALELSPFPLLLYVPVQAMQGKLLAAHASSCGLIGAFWAAALFAILLLLWHRGSQRFLGFGV